MAASSPTTRTPSFRIASGIESASESAQSHANANGSESVTLGLDLVSESEEDRVGSSVIDSDSKSHDALAGPKTTSSCQNPDYEHYRSWKGNWVAVLYKNHEY